ncbi:MAG: type II secretion system F family protein, partial [Fimbriimonadales bacterium]
MPVYRYQAVDSGGRVESGELNASDVHQAQQILAGRGLRVVLLAAAPSASARPVQATGGISRGDTPHAARWERSSVAPHTMTVWLLQLRSMLKAGMSPVDSLQSLSQRTADKALQRATLELARDAAQGVALSDSMRKFPNLFPAFLVGAFRAAEHGGYLPEMLDRLVDYYEHHRTVRRWSLLVQGCLWHAVLLLPLVAPFGIGFTWGLRDYMGGSAPDALRAILGGFGQAFLRYGLPM